MSKHTNLIAVTLSVLSLSSATADELKDFGFRATLGGMSGVTSVPLPEASLWADFYMLSQQTRMVFGFSMLSPPQPDLPLISIQSIGVEQNLPLPTGQLFAGLLYSKTYLSEEHTGFDPQRGTSMHLGYKYPIDTYQDLVFMVGQQYQPLKKSAKAPDIELDSQTYYARLGWEWYF